jgi:hypothetical protein
MLNMFAFVVAYFLLLALLVAAARPQRKRLYRMCDSLLASDVLNDRERALVGALRWTALSLRAAPMGTLSFLQGLIATECGIQREAEEFSAAYPKLSVGSDARMMIEAYMASIAAVNPIFGVTMYVARWLMRTKLKLIRRHKDGTRVSSDMFALEAAART